MMTTGKHENLIPITILCTEYIYIYMYIYMKTIIFTYFLLSET